MIGRPSIRPHLWLLLLAAASLRASPQGSSVDPALLSPIAYGQGSQPGQGARTVRGTVVDGVSGAPIYRALVQVGGQYATLTDHEGHFEFTGVTGTNVPPWAMKPGYFSESNRGNSLAASAESFGASERDQSLVVKLMPEAVISGTMTGEDGGPIEGVPVGLKTLTVQDGLERWRQRLQTKTNAEGQYRFAELQAGRYIVTSNFHTDGLADSQGGVAYGPTRYPGLGSAASTESAIVLKPGDHAVADLSPDAVKLFPVTGAIEGYPESGGVGFRVETQSGDEIAPISQFMPRTGEFRLMLPEGSYQLTATAYSRENSEGRRQLTVPHGPVSGVSFAMEPYASIPVDVEVQSINQPADSSGQLGGLPRSGVGANISMISVDGMGSTPFLSAQPVRRPGLRGDDLAPGPMMIEHIAPGRYALRAQPQPPWYVASASCGGVDLLHEELAIGGGAVGCSIRIVLRNDSGLVHVTIRDAEASSSAGENLFVYLLPVGDLVHEPVISSGWSPGYEGYQVAPGRYLVLAMDHHEELPYRDPDAMRRYASMGQEVAVTANGKADAEIGVAKGAQ